jgi:hypothetical protein
MPSSLRLGALLFASVSADQISLMQDVKKSSKRDGKHMSALMESAKCMLKNGATPDVVSFAEETLADIADVVIPAIVHESRIQQAAVMSKWEQFRHLINIDLPEWKRIISEWSDEVSDASRVHKECRDIEHCLCYGEGVSDADCCPDHTPDCGKRPCEIELYRLWTIWVAEETDLREFHTNIHGHFCPTGANGTTAEFRRDSIPWMNSYMSQKVVVDAAEAAYDNFRPQCIVDHNNLDERSTQCNTYQFTLESKACSEMRAVEQTLADFAARYSDLDEEADALWANARTDEIMRHREYKQIKIVECLLDRIHELNGRPCDDATGEVDAEMSHCHAEGELIQICQFQAGNEPLTENILRLSNAGDRYETRDEAVHLDSIMTGRVSRDVDPNTLDDLETTNNLVEYDIHGENTLLGHDGWKYFQRDPNVPLLGSTQRDFESAPQRVAQGSICIVYPEKPEIPPPCGPTPEFPGVEPCLPVPPPHPCDAVWTQQQITGLPGFPIPDFSATNPGCNEYPACTVCGEVTIR